jgi:hypothetical protein
MAVGGAKGVCLYPSLPKDKLKSPPRTGGKKRIKKGRRVPNKSPEKKKKIRRLAGSVAFDW